jgi:Na+-transporting NADH:ubiquinone oxidoreductase subunit NqrF
MSTIIILGVAMFTFVILALVFVLLAAKARLVNSEAVTIGINHDPAHSLRVPAGNTLLNTLASNKIAGGYIQIDIPKYDIKFKDFDHRAEVPGRLGALQAVALPLLRQ